MESRTLMENQTLAGVLSVKQKKEYVGIYHDEVKSSVMTMC